jgi:hypothetical protein
MRNTVIVKKQKYYILASVCACVCECPGAWACSLPYPACNAYVLY